MRHAVYFTPAPASELHLLGSLWLGRDALTCEKLRQSDSRLAALTGAPRRYGFHGTLKPPFHLRENMEVIKFDSAVKQLAAQHRSFLAPPLELRVVDGFLALVLAEPCPMLDVLAANCVRQLDDFRSPADDAELNRRRQAGLSAAQEQLLLRWGYPYVLDEFHFHMSLTERLSSEELRWVMPMAESHFAPVLGRSFVVDAVTTMLEPGAGNDFRILERFPLASKAQRAA